MSRRCENGGCRRTVAFIDAETGHGFCIEDTSSFISWQLDGGPHQAPELWAWAYAGPWPKAAPLGPIGWPR